MVMINYHQSSFHLSNNVGSSTELVESIRIHQNCKIRISWNLALRSRESQIFDQPFRRGTDTLRTTNGQPSPWLDFGEEGLESVSGTHRVRVSILMTEKNSVLSVAESG